MVVVVLAVLGACASGSTPAAGPGAVTTSTPAPWADAADAYVDAYLGAWNSGHLATVERFLTEGASVSWVFDAPPRGREALEGWLRGWLPVSKLHLGLQRTYVATSLAVLIVSAAADAGRYAIPEGFDGLPMLIGLGLGDEAVAAHMAAWPAAMLDVWRASPLRLDPQRDGALLDLVASFRRYADAWNAGDLDGLAGGYDVHAALEDSLAGVGVTGPASITARAADLGVGQPGASLRLDEVTFRGALLPAVFVSLADSWRAAAGAYRLDPGDGCERSLVRLVVPGDDGLGAEQVAWDVASVRRCGLPGGAAPAPGGWWEQVRIPSFERVRTGEVTQGDGSAVPVLNGSPAQERLVEWGLGRFAEAGLPVEGIAAFVFPPSAACDALAGATVDANDGVEIHLCYTADAVCPAGAACASPALAPRRTVLHELAHQWEARHVDDATRAAFMRLRDVAVWIDESGDWSHQGSEHAAEIVAWGLLDEAVPLVRFPRHSCAELLEAFRLLTATEPLLGPETCAAG